MTYQELNTDTLFSGNHENRDDDRLIRVGPLVVDFEQVRARRYDSNEWQPIAYRELQLLVICDGGVISVDKIAQRMAEMDRAFMAYLDDSKDIGLDVPVISNVDRMANRLINHRKQDGQGPPDATRVSLVSIRHLVAKMNQDFGYIFMTHNARGYSLQYAADA